MTSLDDMRKERPVDRDVVDAHQRRILKEIDEYDGASDPKVDLLRVVRFQLRSLSRLPDADRQTFVDEVTATLNACLAVGNFDTFADLMVDWVNTAALWSDPIATTLQGDIDNPVNTPVRDDIES